MEIQIVMWLGFLLASWSVIGNDVIQTLGTFLSSNNQRKWWVLTIYAASILTVVLFYGWLVNDGDVSYDRLLGEGGIADPKYKDPTNIENFGWPYLLPPLILFIITRLGIPVSTSFMILTFFNPKNLYDMVVKSMSGYLVAFGFTILLFLFFARSVEKKWIENPLAESKKKWWTVVQWTSTGFLWSQWLIQDFANIYVYLPRQIDLRSLIITLVIFWVMLGYLFKNKGGAIQAIVTAKTNVQDIRSATIIDLIFAIILFFFKELNKIPMSTTWVFLGLLAGREIGINYFVYREVSQATLKDLGMDLAKVFFGLIVSVALVFLVRWLVS